LRELPEITFRALRRTEPLEVALMLPISVDGRANDNYLEFYQGFLLGLEQVKQRYGYSANLTFYNSGRDTTAIRRIVESPEFARTQLIVGPVYEDELHPVIQVAEQRSIPVVSPLANIGGLRSDALFQMAADPALKYDKVAELFNGNRRVTLIYADKTDKEFEQEVLALLGDRPYTRHNYRYEHPSVRKAEGSPSDLTPLLQNKEENVFVILAENEVDVDRILAAIASADTSITSRGFTAPSFVVLGNARWHRFNNIDRTMFFKDRMVFVSTYHAKRDAAVITDFDSSYIRSFGALPTLYSYRGYDAAMIFCPAMYGDIEKDLENTSYTPLQTTYRFERDDEGNHVNRNWTRVNYNSDYTITIE
jgi:ABC-type branched-subunit amino acid transport system substrate-binding protein